MKKNVDNVLNGYANLSNDEKSEFIRRLNEFNKAKEDDQKVIRKSLLESLSLGPLGDTCKCCSR